MKQTWMFVISLLGMAVSAAGLILLIPPFFDPGAQGNVWAAGILACLALVLAVGALYWRPSASGPHGG